MTEKETIADKSPSSNPPATPLVYIIIGIVSSVILVLLFTQSDLFLTIFLGAFLVVLGIGAVFYEQKILRLRSVNKELKDELEIQSETISHISNFDKLTDLPHRDMTHALLDQFVEVARRRETNLGVLQVDLDYFHSLNEELGTEVGDRVLMEVARRLKALLRKSDVVGRFGADEFLAVLMDPIDAATAALVARKIQDAMEVPFPDLMRKSVTCSVGISLFPKDGEDSEQLISASSQAVQVAKSHGRNQFQLFNKEVQKELETRQRHTHGLSEALKKKQFSLYFQPKINQDKSIIGAEALIRWEKPGSREIILPNHFIPLAEETGIIVPMGYWVIEEACRQYMQWRERGFPRFRVSVNVSPLQLKDPQFLERIVSILQETRMNPRDLELEITESALADDVERMVKLLAEFHTLGISISIDDFGTGYSSLSKLSTLPLDVLKVDKSFIDPLVDDPRSRSITRLIIQMAHSLGLNVIAEGVETEDQFTLLMEWGCSHIQGYIFSPPLATDDFEALLSKLVEKVV